MSHKKRDDRDLSVQEPKMRAPRLFPSCESVKKFEKLNMIAEGSYGKVYRAKDRETGEILALKQVKVEVDEVQGFSITSLRETTLLTQLNHPNVVNVKEVVVGETLRSVTLVMEFLEHDLKTLQDDMKGPFLAPEVKCLIRQLLLGVNYLHSNWVLHRDLKTANLLLNNQGILKIGDFGLAREFGSPQKRLSPNVVTLWYRAPELLLGDKDYTPAIDMWSVGCIFAELLTQTPLFDGKGEIEQITKIFTTLGTPTEEIWPGVSDLPIMKQFSWKNHIATGLREKLPVVTSATLDLLSGMLTLDPKQRITAEEALRHRYFQEDPPPQIPSMMPTFPSRAEGGSIKKRTFEDYMSGQVAETEGGLLNDSLYTSTSFQLKFA